AARTSLPVAPCRCCRRLLRALKPSGFRFHRLRSRSKRRWDVASEPAWVAPCRGQAAAMCWPVRRVHVWGQMRSIGAGSRTPFMNNAIDLSTDLGKGLRLRTPVMVASGTFGYGFDASEVDRSALGGIV